MSKDNLHPGGKPHLLDEPQRRPSTSSHVSKASGWNGVVPHIRISTFSRATLANKELDELMNEHPRVPVDELEKLAQGEEEIDPASARGKIRYVLEDSRFDTMMGLVIILNVTLMISETNTKAACHTDTDCTTTWQSVFNYLFQVLYTFELGARLYSYKRVFFQSRWNILDMFIVVIGYIDIIVTQALSGKSLPGPGASILRIFRIARLLRVARILSFFPELYSMIRGFVGAMMAMFWGMFMITVLLLIWSILAVEVIYPTVSEMDNWEDGHWCKEGFSAVQKCMLFFFQTVFAGDSWGTCAVPIIQESFVTALIFGGALITIQLGFTNLVLAVIVERAAKAQDQDAEKRIKEQQKRHEHAVDQLRSLMMKIDEDDSGQLTLEEILKGYEKHRELPAILSAMDINKDDLQMMFGLLADEDGNAEIEDFVENLERCESQDLRRQMLLMGLQVTRIQRTVEDTMEKLTGSINEEEQRRRHGKMKAAAAEAFTNFSSSRKESLGVILSTSMEGPQGNNITKKPSGKKANQREVHPNSLLKSLHDLKSELSGTMDLRWESLASTLDYMKQEQARMMGAMNLPPGVEAVRPNKFADDGGLTAPHRETSQATIATVLEKGKTPSKSRTQTLSAEGGSSSAATASGTPSTNGDKQSKSTKHRRKVTEIGGSSQT